MRTIALTVTALLGMYGCRITADMQLERTALQEADLAFAKATAEQGADGWVSYFTQEGVMFRPGGSVVGTDSIRSLVTPWFADEAFTLSWTPTRAEVAQAGDLGYTVGRYESSGRDAEGNVVWSTGSYVTIWRKQADGSWKVALDIGSPDGP